MKAAVITGNTEGGQWIKVAEAPVPEVDDDHLLIKAVAYAANPTDWKHCTFGSELIGNHAGSDVSGIVEKVGANVKGFQVGDIVSATMHGNMNKTNSSFSDYVVAQAGYTLKYEKSAISDAPLSVGTHKYDYVKNFEGAASLTLSMSTVATSFAGNMQIPKDKAANQGKSILIWGGATAAGLLAIQVAKLAYGLKVITTASKRHADTLKDLGADAVFDYNDKDVIEQIKKEANGSIAFAVDTVANDTTFQQTYDATADSKHLELDSLLFKGPDDIKTDSSRSVNYHKTLMYSALGNEFTDFGLFFKRDQPMVDRIAEFWTNSLPSILPKIKTGNLIVLKAGLESANEAYDLLYQNKVNAGKVVFRAN